MIMVGLESNHAIAQSSRNRRGRVLFISHGSPSYAAEDNPTVRFWTEFGSKWTASFEAAIVISAHAHGRATLRGGGAQSTLAFDFTGFPEARYEQRWSPPLGYEPGRAIVSALQSVGMPVDQDPEGSLDHGVWVPLKAMWPAPTFPVFSLTLPEDPDLDHWWQMGERMALLLDRPYLWIGSGGIVHNLRELDWSRRFGSGAPWAQAFSDWVIEALARGDRERITHPESGPGGIRAVPTREHYAPLALVAALAQPERLVPLYQGFDYGSLSLHIFGDPGMHLERNHSSHHPLETLSHAEA